MTATSSSSPPAATQPLNPADCYIHFPEGLVGCGSWKKFVLLTEEHQDLPVGVLQCLDEPGVILMVTDPALVQPGYKAVLTAEDRKALGLPPGARPVLYSTLTLASDGTITANLLGPLAINPQTRQGKQLVLSDTSYSARHPVGTVKADSCLS